MTMDEAVFKDYLENRYNDQLQWYDKKAQQNQRRYKRLQWGVIVLAATAPVLAALDGQWVSLKIPVVVISALVAVLTTALKTFNYQELWIAYRTTHETLKPELHLFRSGTGPYEGVVDPQALFVVRVEAALGREHSEWLTARVAPTAPNAV